MKTFIEILKGIVVKLGGTTKNNTSEFGVIKAIEEAVGAFATNTQNSINGLVEDVTAVENRVTALEEGGGGSEEYVAMVGMYDNYAMYNEATVTENDNGVISRSLFNYKISEHPDSIICAKLINGEMSSQPTDMKPLSEVWRNVKFLYFSIPVKVGNGWAQSYQSVIPLNAFGNVQAQISGVFQNYNHKILYSATFGYNIEDDSVMLLCSQEERS